MTEIRDWLTKTFRAGYFVPIQNADRETGKFPLADLIGIGGWQLKTTNFIAVAGGRYRIDATAGDVVMTLPTGNTTAPDVEIQRIDPPFVNDVLIRTPRINGQTGVDGVFSPANPHLTERLSFAGGLLGYLGQFDRLTYQAYTPSSTSTTLIHASDGDTNGLFHWLGTELGTVPWSNPAGTSNLAILASSVDNGTVEMVTDRAPSNYYSGNSPGQWVAWDLGAGKTISIDKYTLRNRNADTNHLPRNWVLEGTNSVASFTAAALNAATWTAIDTRANDTTLAAVDQYYTVTINGSNTGFRYLRFSQTGANSNGQDYLTVNEFEFYGVFDT